MTASTFLTALAVVLFVLAAFGITLGADDRLEIIAWGLGAFALAHLVP